MWDTTIPLDQQVADEFATDTDDLDIDRLFVCLLYRKQLRNKAQRERRERARTPRADVTLHCSGCGMAFTRGFGDRGRSPTFCSGACRLRSWRDQQNM
jgi:Arc/MetJ family transcription regulator